MVSAVPNMIGASPEFQRVMGLIEQMARYDAPVLICGETGTGKELAARAIHYLGVRKGAPFVPLNCGALPDTLVESELFGYERGAFTDARAARIGLIASAEGGTLFLDEIDSLPARAQVSLLRFLQDQTYRPLGGTREQSGNVRIVAAASPRLPQMIASGAFRTDLAFRLDVLSLELPPLRTRQGDARLLAQHFSRRYASRYQLPQRPFDLSSLVWLDQYAWPGNVRELDNLIHRQTLLCARDELVLIPSLAQGAVSEELPCYNSARSVALAAWEREYLGELLRRTGGNVTRAAELAGKERRALGKLIKKHGIDRSGFESHVSLSN
ncbi:MAG TPA: sigma-54 dependent transcriptional regulator [Rhodocyclaceae bacterium]|nr:sigma-54 dependent transcriptional regulator [Rhodocyclaceae bacterium]